MSFAVLPLSKSKGFKMLSSQLARLKENMRIEINDSQEKLKRFEQTDLDKHFRRLRKEILEKLDSLSMNPDRKSYFLHQLGNTHELAGLIELIEVINELQLSEESFVSELDLISLEVTTRGPQIAFKVFSPQEDIFLRPPRNESAKLFLI